MSFVVNELVCKYNFRLSHSLEVGRERSYLFTSSGWAKYSSVGSFSSLASLIKRLTPGNEEEREP